MRRLAAALFLSALSAAPAAAQSGIYSRAVPPDKPALDRLNLVSDWAAYVPVSGRQDGLSRVQAVDENQVFVQTRSGTLVALDAKTGREQWRFKYPAAFTDGYPVGVNEQFVYSVNVAKLFCHQRYTGTLEFEVNLPDTPATGPVTDGDLLYLTFTGARVACYELPPSYRTSEAAKREAKALKEAKAKAGQTLNPADDVVSRNAVRNFSAVQKDSDIEQYNVPTAYMTGRGGASPSQITPSVTVLQSVVPPYLLGGLNKVVAITMLPNLRQPYTSRPDYMTHNQISPSVTVMPPSLVRVYELSNLRPPPFEPKLKWMNETDQKVYHEPLFVPDNTRAATALSARLWVTEDGKTLRALARNQDETGAKPQVWPLPAKPAAALAGPFAYDKSSLLGVLPLADGQVLGIDLTGGTSENPRYEWRANVGGPLNRTPIAAADGVYVGGDNAGCARINVVTGQVDWRTTPDVDRIAAVTDKFVYARDRRGSLLVYAKGQVADPATLRARPIGVLPAADFGVPVANGQTDRVLMAADNGLVVCLRDAGAKYAKPTRQAPPPIPPEEKKADTPDTPKPADGDVKPADLPKPADPPKADTPKKDEPKK